MPQSERPGGTRSPEQNAPLIPSSQNEDPDVLRQRFLQYGYLYFPQLANANACEQLMQAFLSELAPHLSYNTELGHPELLGEPFFETDPLWDEVYPKMQALECFHRFFERPELSELMRVVVNKPVFQYPMKMARIATPRKMGYETPPHQDAHSHQAGPTMAGIWIALHDMDSSMGRLKLLPFSHRRGVRPVHQAEGVGGVQCEIYEGESEWHVSDYRQGDVIVFHACCVHKAEPNTAERAARMSVDTRFCDYGAPVFCNNFEPHHGWRIEQLDWDYIYRNWEDSSGQYYWRDYPNRFETLMSERDDMY